MHRLILMPLIWYHFGFIKCIFVKTIVNIIYYNQTTCNILIHQPSTSTCLRCYFLCGPLLRSYKIRDNMYVTVLCLISEVYKIDRLPCTEGFICYAIKQINLILEYILFIRGTVLTFPGRGVLISMR